MAKSFHPSAAVDHLIRSDAVLAGMIQRLGPFAMQYLPADFETLVRSIVSQQVSGKVAKVIFERVRAAGASDGQALQPEAVLKMRVQRLRRLGLSPQKAEYVRNLARQTVDGAVRFEELPALPDQEVIRRLTQVRGIGVWTAQMFLMFALRRPDVLPTSDLGIRTAMQRAYGLPELPKPAAMEDIARPWRPYASAACWYLWRSLEGVAGL